jgi:transcriptional regulator with XRE-family HTH domain
MSFRPSPAAVRVGVSRARRREIERRAKLIALKGRVDGKSDEELAEAIVVELPDVLLLEAHRYARGWTRADLSRALDILYERDGLRPPGIGAEQICNWEHGRTRPSAERLDYLCRVYETRPDRLGFGTDYASLYALGGSVGSASIGSFEAAGPGARQGSDDGGTEHVPSHGLDRADVVEQRPARPGASAAGRRLRPGGRGRRCGTAIR